jgi:CheY-like chemotaxis protein
MVVLLLWDFLSNSGVGNFIRLAPVGVVRKMYQHWNGQKSSLWPEAPGKSGRGPGKRKHLRVLIPGKDGVHDQFHSIVATNIRHWGYEAVLLPVPVARDPRQVWQEIEGDILLYDMDVFLPSMIGLRDIDSGVADSASATQVSGEVIWPRVRLIMALSSRSVSRLSLERIGAITLLHKPFDVGHLERYLRVFQQLLYTKPASNEALMISKQACRAVEEKETCKASSAIPVRILVADDRQEVTGLIRQCLLEQQNRRYHFEVREAYDGLNLLEQCLTWRPHCVVTDLLMPWLNGYQVMHCLADSEVRPLPAFVVISALTQHEAPMDRSYLQDQVVLYVNKPFDIENLLATVEQALAE